MDLMFSPDFRVRMPATLLLHMKDTVAVFWDGRKEMPQESLFLIL